MSSWDYIVIGAGIMGAYTAYTLAKGGWKVLMIEQVWHTAYVVN